MKSVFLSVVRCYASTKGPLRFDPRSASRKPGSFQPSSLALLVVPCATFALGVWQTKRRIWKLNLIEDMEKRLNKEPIPLPSTPEECSAMEYERVKVKGTFDYERRVLVGPRSLVQGGEDVKSSSGIAGSSESSGWWVINPFILSDRQETVLVNRGWVPLQSVEGYEKGEILGETEITAIPRKSERKNPYTPEIDLETKVFHTRNISALAKKLGTSPIYLDCYETIPGGPLGAQTRVSLPNDHLSYMMTWFSLSGITLFMWFKRFVLK